MAIIIILAILGLAGAGMLFVGVRGLLTRRAAVYSGRWLFALIALCFFPQFLNSFKLLGAFPAAAMIGILIYPLLLLVFWVVTKGYICFGVSEETVNSALKSAFEKLGIKHEPSLGSVKLEDGGIFQVSVQDWVGTMQIKAKNSQAAGRLPALVSAISEYFAAYSGKIKFLPYWIYAVCGGMMLGTLLVLLGIAARLR
jgi:hypothetical protein